MSAESSNDNIKGTGRRLSASSEALQKFGEELVVNSVNSINDFAKTLITLTSGFFAAYFALLKFLGVENIVNPLRQMLTNDVVLPPIFLSLALYYL